MSEEKFSFTDNNDGTITRTIDDNKYVYNILVDNNIPENESIIDYCYYQFDEHLLQELRKAGIGEDQFCSGTCVAMVLAIKYGDKNIKPEDVIYFNEENSDDNDEEKKEVNWIWGINDNGDTYDKGLKDWEKDKDTKNDGGQVYDNRYWDEETQTYHYDSVNGEIKNDEDYLKEIKSNLEIGQPIIIHVSGHFVVVVGVEADVSLDDATFEQLVIFDPATKNKHKIATLGNAYNKNYKIDDYRMIMPYLIDEKKEIVRDENGMPSINPYYLEPYKYSDGDIMPFKEYNAVKSIIESNIYDQGEKERIVRFITSTISHKKISDEEYLNIKKACEDKSITAGATVTTTVTYAKANVTTARVTKYDPLILDLDGDGYNIETKELGANFDLDKNGFAEKINWTSRDGFLCLDLNGNGSIDDGGELFGDQTLLADGKKAKNGFEALAQYDSNGDGVIDAGDEIFDSLRIWVDADGNGVTGEGEMKTLAELGITSINLGYENVNAETGTEATIGNTATFTRDDGTIGGVGELWVSSDLFDTVDNMSVEVSDEIKELPNVRSIGNVYSLHNAMALDETGELKALVESFAAEEDADKRMAIAEQILFFISGANGVAAGSRGKYIDARQLAVIEAMLGEKYVGTSGANPHSDAAPMLKSAYKDLLNMYFNELNAQTFIKDYAALLRYTENEDGTKTLNADLVNYILEYQLESGDENAEKMLTEVARYVQYLDDGGIKGINSFIMNYAAISAEYAAEIVKVMPNGYVSDGENPLKGTNSGDFLAGSNNDDEIYGYNGNDILIGGKGNDNLYGGYGDDTYIFNLGDGNDVINEQNTRSASDRVVFGEGISAEDVEFVRNGNDMIVKIKDTEDSIRIVNQYSDSWYWVEKFEFADGTVVNLQDLLSTTTLTGSGLLEDFTSGYGNRNSTLIGSDEADSIYGYDGNDILIGGKGNDNLYGGYGDDTYIFNLGDGNDVINEQNTRSASDRVVFGEGITAENIMFQNSGGNMVISFVGSDDTITITKQFSDSWYRIENFSLSDGTVIDYAQVNLLIQSMAAFEADTGMTWAEAAEQPTEEYSDIISQMWVKTA